VLSYLFILSYLNFYTCITEKCPSKNNADVSQQSGLFGTQCISGGKISVMNVVWQKVSELTSNTKLMKSYNYSG